MNFSVGDILLDRFRLVELLRDEPGLSAWLAQDSTLQRNCQIFIVSNSAIISRVNIAASALALSHNPHFIQVLHLHRDGEICAIVTDEDPGISLYDYMNAHDQDSETYPLTHTAIRSIIAELANSARELEEDDLAHYCINDINTRLTRRGVILANFPISSGLVAPVASTTSATHRDTEGMMVYHIAALAFYLLTHTVFSSSSVAQGRETLEKAHCPHDLFIICTRALGLPDNNGKMPIPLVTLLEMSILLDDYTSFEELLRANNHDISINGITSSPSIEIAHIKTVKADNLVDIPDTFLKKTTSADDDTTPPEWTPSELIFGGSKAVDLTTPDIDTNLFHALGELDENKLKRTYDPYDFNDFALTDTQTIGLDTQAIKAAIAPLSQSPTSKSLNVEDTQSIPPIVENAQIPVSHNNADCITEETSNAQENNDTNTKVIEEQPPSYAPRPRSRNVSRETFNSSQEKQLEENQSKTTTIFATNRYEKIIASLKNFSQTRFGAITITAVVLVVLLFLSLYSLGIGHFAIDSQSSDPWSQIPDQTVRFPGHENNKGTNESEPSVGDNHNSHTQDTKPQKKTIEISRDGSIKPIKIPAVKKSSAVPQPVGTSNTTPIKPKSYRFLNRPAGLRGWGYIFTLERPTTIWKLELTNQSGGGQVHIYADPKNANPTTGTEVATFSFADNNQPTTVILKRPINATSLVVWVDGTDATTLPRIVKLTHYALY